MGLRGAYRLFGGDFKVIIWGSSRKVLEPDFMGAVDLWKHQARFSFGNWRKTGLYEMVKKLDRKRFYVSGNFFCTISFLVKILLADLRNFVFSMLESQSSKNKIVTKM